MSEWKQIFSAPDCAVFSGGNARLRVQALHPNCLRITQTEGESFVLRNEPMIERAQPWIGAQLSVAEYEAEFVINAGSLRVRLCRQFGSLRYEVNGALLTGEPERDGRLLRPIDIIQYEFDPDAPLREEMGVDGARVRAQGVPHVDRQGYQTRLHFQFQPGESIYGLGQHEEGILNYRGCHQYLYQHNLKVACPVLFSSRGWGLLYNSLSAMTFHDDAQGSYLSSDADAEMDFFFLYGPEFDDMIHMLRELTGRAPIPPKWAFGYVQSKERYKTQQELIDTVRQHRERGIPLDLIVQDWHTWPQGQWGQKTVDAERYPDLAAATDALHALNARLMWSIWPNMNGDGANRREFMEKGYLLGNRSTYNAFAPEARAMYWRQANEGLFERGVDAWWCDCTEPFEADWFGPVAMTPEDRMQFDVAEFKKYLDPAMINAYSIQHSRGIYEGQRAATNEKRVLNLTRSGFPGQQRYGTITWNGDTSARWEVMQKSIADGLNFCLSGQPYWTMDVGAFFVKRWTQWFGRGEYEAGCDDPGYRELYLRWFQLGTFLPMLRAHGTDTPREIWQFGEAGEFYYDALLRMIRLRTQLVPYLYSLAGGVYFDQDTMLRMLAFDFRADAIAREVNDQFMLGRALMVCPVVRPGATTRRVYLPDGAAWYDFWTNECHVGGRWIDAAAPLDRIPVYVRAGSLLPIGPVRQYVDEPTQEPLVLRAYAGCDCDFTLYDDAGDGYGYERGEYARIDYHWDDAAQQLSESRSGDGRYVPERVVKQIIRP